MASLIGETLGNYKVLSVIGQGGMGQVFLAEHPLIGKRAAVKVLLPQYSNDPEIVNRFFNEARSATLIRHPGIVEIFDFGHHANGSAYIIMEYLEGESLADRLKRERPLPFELAIEISRQMAGALGAAHQKGIVHRDLKPDNVYLVNDPDMPLGVRTKLLDFGIAKLSSGAAQAGINKTRTGMMMGTPQYMSPEQCRGAGSVDHRADIYSLGCMIFEMCTGRVPFVFEGPGEIIAAHIFQPPPQLRDLAKGVPPVLDQAVARALSKQADQRQASAFDLARELDSITPRMSGRMHQVSVSTPPPSMTPVSTNTPDARTSVPPISTTLQAAASEVGLESGGRSRGWVVPVIGGLVAGLGIVAFVMLRPKPPAPVAQIAPEKLPEKAPEKLPVKVAEKTPEKLPEKPPEKVAQKVVQKAPEKVRWAIGSDPAGAEVFRAADGVRLGLTPYQSERPPSDGEVVFLLKLSGYADQRVTLPADRDGDKQVKLHKKHVEVVAPPPPKKKIKNGVLDPFGN